MRTDVRQPITPGIDSALMVAGAAAGDIAAEVDELAAPQLEVLVPALAATIARFESARLRALQAADRVRVGDRAGMASTAAWAAAVTGERRGKARSDCELAGKLAAKPTFADALANGAVSKAQAAALADAEKPSEDEQRDLLDDAAGMSVNELERLVARFNLDRNHARDPVVPSVTITNTERGVNAAVTLDALGGEIFTTAIDAAAQKLSFEKGTPLALRRAAGLTAISRFFLEHHPEVTHRLGRPHVIVKVPLDVLTHGDAGGSAQLASGTPVDAATARRMACDASVSRLIAGPLSEPLDIGRATRSIPVPMARQLIVEDEHCRWPGCDSPPWACEGHHVRWWESPYLGETKLGNLVLLCWHHHHLLHKDGGWQLTLDPATRRLDVGYRDRPIGSTDPPGRRRRTGPVPAPASTTTTAAPNPPADPRSTCQSALFDAVAADSSSN